MSRQYLYFCTSKASTFVLGKEVVGYPIVSPVSGNRPKVLAPKSGRPVQERETLPRGDLGPGQQ